MLSGIHARAARMFGRGEGGALIQGLEGRGLYSRVLEECLGMLKISQ